ncbi:MAG: radical SAM protein [Bacteroidales bacterium]|nr:radical SAM protein [Bacteroidales bacterium]
MLDPFKRNISYLRISVTDRCNLRCSYCMPEGIKQISRSDVLSFEEIVEVVKFSVGLGIKKIRITGGEPLVRKGIVHLIEMIASVKGIEDLAMTTNGVLLEKYADSLAKAGLKRVNVSLDTVDRMKFVEITQKDVLKSVFKGIDAAQKAGLTPVKINCVLLNKEDSEYADGVKAYAVKNGLNIRFIHQMNLKTGDFSVIEGGTGGNCKICNRIRLTSNGLIKPCLFSDFGYHIRKLGIEKAILLAIGNKPESGTFNHSEDFLE